MKVQRYTNEHGEQWELLFDSNSGIGYLTGNDVDWCTFYVIRGECLLLVLNTDEKKWIKECWNKFREENSKSPKRNIYME